MEAGRVLGVATLKGVDARCVLHDASATVLARGIPVPGGEVFTVARNREAAAAFVVDEGQLDSSLVAACLMGDLAARAETKIRNGIVTVENVRLEHREGRGTCWASDTPKRFLPDTAQPWWNEITLAALGLGGRRRASSKRTNRPRGHGIAQLTLKGLISQRSAALLVEEIERAKGQSIALDIESDGGSADGGRRIYEALARHGYRVEAAIGANGAHSAASLVAMAADLRQIQANASMVVHQSYIAGKRVRAGNVDSIAKLLRRSVASFATVYAQATDKPVETTTEWMARNTRFTAIDALRAGLVHEVTKGGFVLFRQADMGLPPAGKSQ